MTSKEKAELAEVIDKMFSDMSVPEEIIDFDEYKRSKILWEKLKTELLVKNKVTEKGQLILDYLSNHRSDKTTATEIGFGLGMSGKTVSGSLRKLVADGLVIKIPNSDPIIYKII